MCVVLCFLLAVSVVQPQLLCVSVAAAALARSLGALEREGVSS